jgi:thymidylate synthase
MVTLNKDIKSVFDFRFEDFHIENYDPHPHIKGAISV